MGTRLLHLADLHLGAKCEQWPGRAADLEATFQRAVDEALREECGADAVIIAGDLFDRHRPASRVVDAAKGQLERLTRAGAPVVMVPGTHDSIEYPDSVLRDPMPDGVHVLKEPNIGEPLTLTIKGEDVHFYGMAYAPARSKAPFDAFHRTDAEGYHVAVIHGSIEGAPDWDMRDRYIPLNLDRLGQTGMHYVALGHYHKFHRYERNRVQVVYPGVLEGLRFADTGNRYLTWVELADGRATVQHQTADAAPINTKLVDVRTLDLGHCAATSMDELAEAIQNWADEKLILQVRLQGAAEFAVDEDALAARLKPHFAFLDVVGAGVSYVDSRRVEEMAQEQTVPGMFIRRLRKQIEAASTPEERAVAELALKFGVTEFLRE